MMDYIVVPQINVELPIYHGTCETVLQSGSGHLAEEREAGGEKADHRKGEEEKKEMRFMKIKKYAKKLLFLTAVLICGNCTAVMAKEAASIQVFYHGTTQEETAAVFPGAEFELFLAGTGADGEWTLTEQFAGSGVSLQDDTASGRQKAADALYEYARENGLEGVTQVTDQNGRAVFSDLEDGLYLISQKGDLTYEEDAFRSMPFLVSVPLKSKNDAPIYQVKVEPKSGWVDETEPDEEIVVPVTPLTPAVPAVSENDAPPETASGKSTGDEAPVLPLVVLLTVSAAVLAFVAVRRKRADETMDQTE